MIRSDIRILAFSALFASIFAPLALGQRGKPSPTLYKNESPAARIVLRPVTSLESVVGGFMDLVKGGERASPANSYLAGRITDFGGLGIRGALITVFDVGTNQSKTAFTGTFGRYQIDGLELGHGYVISIQHNRYIFVTGSIFIEANGDPIGIDFQAEEIP